MMRVPQTRRAPSPRPNSGLPEFGNIDWPKSDISDFGWGEGWGEGVRVYREAPPPSPAALCASTSPLRGEVKLATRAVGAPT